MFRMILFTALLVVTAALSTCSVKPDGPGQCKISCGSAMIAPADYEIKTLTDDLNIRCAAAGNVMDTYVKFGVFKKSRVGDQPVRQVAVPNISVQPLVVGLVDTQYNEGKSYAGVQTSTDEFCSDSCGAVNLRVAVKCPTDDRSEVAIYIHSGVLKSERALVTVESPELGTVETDE